MKEVKVVAHIDKKGGGHIFWGFVLIAAAVLIIIDALGIGPELPFVKLVCGVLCAGWLLKELLKLHIAGIFFPIAFAFMIFEREIGTHFGLGENLISNWLVLLTALLLTVGFALLFGNTVFSRGGKRSVSSGSKNHFGDGVKYIDCSSFEHEAVKNSFGEYNVYFQNTDSYGGGGILEVSNAFGEVNIHVPSDWNVRFEVKNQLGEVAVRGEYNPNGKDLLIIGSNKFGETNAIME